MSEGKQDIALVDEVKQAVSLEMAQTFLRLGILLLIVAGFSTTMVALFGGLNVWGFFGGVAVCGMALVARALRHTMASIEEIRVRLVGQAGQAQKGPDA